MTAPQPPRPTQPSAPTPLEQDTVPVHTDSPKQLVGIYIRGMAMGAADIVPGVSGGTIALIAGIYERLINALGSIGPNLWTIFRQEGGIKGFAAIWRQVDATFLLCLLLGIATSFATLAGIIKHLLDNQPLLIWSFFFGLVVATVFILLSEIKRWNIGRAVLFATGLIAAVVISSMPLLTTTPSLPYLFFAGAIAICAMILPGISGSFILLLLGAYDAVLEAVDTMNLSAIFTVIAGMATGLLLFTRALKWLLSHYYQATLALLTGFIAGSLIKVWPWKVDALGSLNTEAVHNVMPWQYPTGAQWSTTVGLMLLGAILVSLLSWWGNRTNRG
ncbi:LOW QUALITY PROTEIN: membrane protein [Psychrobacter sp. JCM 18901]|nr:LOW QUALITY PROTEIN: membrane protein [Psychrobacter sp. JCM 18901]